MCIRDSYHPVMKEFLLMYDDVRGAASPRETLLSFLQSTYCLLYTSDVYKRQPVARMAPAGPASAPGCGMRWPRHCFSSHSTQNVRPCDTGKPQALHFCKFLNSSGTGID